MRLKVVHETLYSYSVPIHALAMESRLQPCNDAYQSCQRYRLSVTPRTPIEQYTTFNDLIVSYWMLLKASEVHVVSESFVEIRQRPLIPVESPPVALDPVEFFPYLNPTILTTATPLVHDFSRQFAQIAAQDWYQATIAVQNAIHRVMKFQPGCTTTETTADDALRTGCGVCQDYTHLMIAVLRNLSIPARYVSGYLNQRPSLEPLHMGETTIGQSQKQGQSNGTGASHAWCEVYFGPDAGWRGFDAANNLLVDQNFVRIGAGRDFKDITPVKGVHKGPAEEALEVKVTVTPVA